MNIDVFRGNLSMLGGCSLRGCSGSGNPLTWRCQVGVLDGLEVAGGALDGESEQVTDAADVAAGGVDLAATPQRNQAHQSLSSCTSIMRRPHRQTVTHADHSSTVGLRVANRRLPADTPLSLARRRNEPESIEIPTVCGDKA
jgi:hypothetical protein